MIDDHLKKILLESTNSSEIRGIEVIQDLWSGYGKLFRISLENTSVILKSIMFPSSAAQHPRGWSSKISHLRKEKSYNVEINWYNLINEKINLARTPQKICSGKLCDNQYYLILEDLKKENFLPKKNASWGDIQKCLKWLANFHSHFFNHQYNCLWETGTYWHLKTRSEELQKLKDIKLKTSASKIDKKLNESKFKTLVHGDAKIENFLFNEKSVAAVDFQYVGGGVGVKDVAYFMSSVFDENELEHLEKKCLDYYFNELNIPDAAKSDWLELYPYAWCDFYRFLKGWAPNHHKLNSYSEKMKKKVLLWI